MNHPEKQNIIKLSDHLSFGKNEVPASKKTGPTPRDMDFIETLFRFLGDKRHTVTSYIRMKLDRKMRALFCQDLEKCKNIREEGRCVKMYFGYLRLVDAGALLASLPELLPGKIEALTYHGDASPENRLMKFAKTFDLAHEDVSVCMLMMLMTRETPGQEKEYSVAKI